MGIFLKVYNLCQNIHVGISQSQYSICHMRMYYGIHVVKCFTTISREKMFNLFYGKYGSGNFAVNTGNMVLPREIFGNSNRLFFVDSSLQDNPTPIRCVPLIEISLPIRSNFLFVGLILLYLIV